MSTPEDRAPKIDLYKRLAAEKLGRMSGDILELQTQITLRDQFIAQLKSLLQQRQGDIDTLKAEIAALKAPPSQPAADINGKSD